MKEVTIIFRDGSDVGLGVLDQVGRRFYHIRFIKNAGQGGTELADKAVEIPIGDVDIIDGYDYEALIGFQDRNRATLEWRGQRQKAKNAAHIEAMEGVDKKIATTMRKWDKENHEPIPPFTSTTTELAEQRGEYAAEKTIQENPENPETPETPEEPFIEETYETGCSVCGMMGGYHAVDCPHGEPDEPEDPINTDVPLEYEQEPLSDYQRPADAPTEEEAQETAVGADSDVDVPF